MTTDARPRRRWLKYSLRSLLILITILAVALGRWVDSAHRQQRAVATIKGHYNYNRCEYDYERAAMSKAMSGSAGGGGGGGGSAGGSGFVFAYQVPEEPEVWWLPARARKALGKDFFQNIYSVVFGEVHSGPNRPSAEQNHAVWRSLASLPGLEHFTSYLEPTDDDLAAIVGLRKLKRIDLMISPELGDGSLANLAKVPNLETLVITGGEFSPAGYAQLAQLKHLRSLQLVSPLHSSSQRRALGSVDVTDDDLAQIARLTGLEELYVRSSKITDAGLAHLASLRKLKKLEIRGAGKQTVFGTGIAAVDADPDLPAGYTAEGVQRLQEALPDCTIKSGWNER